MTRIFCLTDSGRFMRTMLDSMRNSQFAMRNRAREIRIGNRATAKGRLRRLCFFGGVGEKTSVEEVNRKNTKRPQHKQQPRPEFPRRLILRSLRRFTFNRRAPCGHGNGYLHICGNLVPFIRSVRRDCALRIANCALNQPRSLFFVNLHKNGR